MLPKIHRSRMIACDCDDTISTFWLDQLEEANKHFLYLVHKVKPHFLQFVVARFIETLHMKKAEMVSLFVQQTVGFLSLREQVIVVVSCCLINMCPIHTHSQSQSSNDGRWTDGC